MARLLGVILSCCTHFLLLGFGLWVFEFTQPPGALQPLRPLVTLELKVPPPPEPAPRVQAPYSNPTSGFEQYMNDIFGIMTAARLPHEYMRYEKLISSHKVERPQQERADDLFFGGGGFVKQGNEVRLSLRGLRAADFGTKDFVGRYSISGEGGSMEVQELPDGRLLFIDHRSGLRRLLHKVGKFIYTYGPDYDTPEPVMGSLTFFPHTRTATDLPSRLMWLPGTPPMKIGTMENWTVEP